MFPKIRCFPKSSHFNRVFHYFHHPFWGFPPIFGNIHINLPVFQLSTFDPARQLPSAPKRHKTCPEAHHPLANLNWMQVGMVSSFGGCCFPSLPKSSKYLVRRCLDPLKAFSGGVCGSKHRSSQGLWKTRALANPTQKVFSKVIYLANHDEVLDMTIILQYTPWKFNIANED